MKFNSTYDRQIKSSPEINSGEILVERSGYQSAESRINNLMLSGQRLIQARKELYDFPDGKIDIKFNDPTRARNYDLADAFQDSLFANERLKASQTASEQRKQAEKAQPGQNNQDPEKTQPGKTE